MLLLRALIHDPRWQPRWRTLFAALVLVVAYFAFMPSTTLPEVTPSDKINHVLAFIALASTLSLAGPGPRAVFLALLAYGGFIEVVQSFLPTRQGDLADLGADVVGIAVGLLLVGLLRRAVKR